jgi:hypothetical protein
VTCLLASSAILHHAWAQAIQLSESKALLHTQKMADDFDFGLGGFVPEEIPFAEKISQNVPLSPDVQARVAENKAKAIAIRLRKEKERQEKLTPTQQVDQEQRQAWKEEMEKKRRAKFATYIEYNLSNINDTKGGFMEEEVVDSSGKRQKREERQLVHDERSYIIFYS